MKPTTVCVCELQINAYKKVRELCGVMRDFFPGNKICRMTCHRVALLIKTLHKIKFFFFFVCFFYLISKESTAKQQQNSSNIKILRLGNCKFSQIQ